MMEKTIGAISKFTGVSVHTIKYYEKIGLIRSHRNEHSNYRSYNIRICTDLYECIKYRNMDFSLKETAVLLKEADDKTLEQMIEHRGEEIDREIQRLVQLKKQVNQYKRELEQLDECLGEWYIERIPHLYIYQQTRNLEFRLDAPMEEDTFFGKEKSNMYQSTVTFSKDYLNGADAEFSWGNGILTDEEIPELEKKGLIHIKKGKAFVFYNRYSGFFSSNGEMAESIRNIYHEFKPEFQSDAYAVRIKATHDRSGKNYEYFKIMIPL